MEMCQARDPRHVRREGNRCANILAKKSFQLCNSVYVSLVEPPLFLLKQLADDTVGFKYPVNTYN